MCDMYGTLSNDKTMLRMNKYYASDSYFNFREIAKIEQAQAGHVRSGRGLHAEQKVKVSKM